jgi:hypothetical protein
VRPPVQYVRVDHVIVLDSVPVGIRLKLRSVANALARKLVIKVDSLQEIYIGEPIFSRKKSGQNEQNYVYV